MESLGQVRSNTIEGNPIEEADLEYICCQAVKEFEVLAGSTLLFTGVGGFLGYYFVKSLLTWNNSHPKKKITVYALDIYPSGIPLWLINKDDIKILKKNVEKYRLPKELSVNYIVHAASIASPVFYRKYPIQTINANVFGLYNLLDFMLKRQKGQKPVKGLLFFSTSEIYGDPTEGNIPTPETYRGYVSCTGPRACYDESKRFGETLCVNYAQVHNLPIKIVRPFNNYGPGLKITDGRVIPDFANNILQNKDITIFSSGSPTRTFCYVTDAIVGYIKALVRGGNGESYNIGTEKPEISITALAQKMQNIANKHFGYSGKLLKQENIDKQYLTDNPNRRCPRISKARKDLGFCPEITLDRGLTNTLLWYKKQAKCEYQF